MTPSIQLIRTLYPVSETPIMNAAFPAAILTIVCLFVGTGLFIKLLPIIPAFKTKGLENAAPTLIALVILAAIGAITTKSYQFFLYDENERQVTMLEKIASGDAQIQTVQLTLGQLVIKCVPTSGEFAGKKITMSPEEFNVPLGIARAINAQVLQPKGIALAVNQ